MKIEQLQWNLRTAVHAVYWGAKRVSPWLDANNGIDAALVGADFEYDGATFPIIVNVYLNNAKPFVEVQVGRQGVRGSHTERRAIGMPNVACIAQALLKCAKTTIAWIPDMAVIYKTVDVGAFIWGDGLDDDSYWTPSRPEHRACSDCLHFTYLRMDPYCNRNQAATEHDGYCPRFEVPPPKPLTPVD